MNFFRSSSYKINLIALLFFSILLVNPTSVLSECTCDIEEEERNTSLALKYKIVAIASILAAGAAGVCLPLLSRIIPALSPERNIFFIVKAFAAGVILSTGFIHVLPDAFESLGSPCISEKPWGEFPFAGFIAMLAGVGTLMVDSCATSYYNGAKLSGAKAVDVGDDEGQVAAAAVHSHGHTHGSVAPWSSESKEVEIRRYRVISQVLELGIIVHSVIIGIALGASQNPKTIKPLIAALTFHQFFEGIGLGGCITQAQFKSRATAIMGLFFSFTTPIGIAIGIGISHVYSETSPTALIVEGTFNSASAGILIYMALVDLLATDFMGQKLLQNGKLRFGAFISLLLGVGGMSVLAKWA